jgi:hypothetical protein
VRRWHIPRPAEDGAFVAPRHDGVEVFRSRPLQFEGREHGPFATRERAERGIDGAFAQGFLGSNRECFARAVGCVPKQRNQHRLDEFAPNGCLVGFAKIWMANLFGPILRGLALLFGRVEHNLGERALEGLFVEKSSGAAKIEAFLQCHVKVCRTSRQAAS